MGNSFTTSLSTAPSEDYDMTLAQARVMVRYMGLTSYSDAKTDQAISIACNEALRLTRCNQTSATLTLTSGQENYNASDVVAGLTTPHILDMRIEYTKLKLTGFPDLARRYSNSSASGKPTLWGTQTPNQFTLYAKPNSAYVLTVRYWSQLVPLASSSTVLNIPREFLEPILTYGAAAVAGSHDPDKRFQSSAWAQFINTIIPSIKKACTPPTVFIKEIQD
jgi:hypothetical protein